MNQINQEIKLSSLLLILSHDISDWLSVKTEKLVEIGKQVIRYLAFQIRFLRHFNYTKENIHDHLLNKAAAFFGYDLEEGKPINKRKKQKRKRPNHSNTSKNKRKYAQSSWKKKLSTLFSEKKSKKVMKNIYHAPG